MADYFLVKSSDFRVDVSRQLQARGMQLLPAPRLSPKKCWVQPPGYACFVSVVADRILVIRRNGATLVITLQVERSTGLNVVSLIGKLAPATIGTRIETRGKLRHVPALIPGRGRRRIHARERRFGRTRGCVVFVAADPTVEETIDRQLLAFPETAIRVHVADVDALRATDRACLIRSVVDIADALLP